MLKWTAEEKTGFAAQSLHPKAQDSDDHTPIKVIETTTLKIGTDENKNLPDKHPYNKPIHIASLNCNGLNEITKRQSIQKYLVDHDIDICALQETKCREDGTEESEHHTLY